MSPLQHKIMAPDIMENISVQRKHEKLGVIDDSTVKHGDIGLAKQAAEEEHNLTLFQAIRLHRNAVLWSVLLSTSIIMEVFTFLFGENTNNDR